MGYYDQTPNNPNHENRSNRKGSKAGYFFSGLAGTIIGALLVWFIISPLADNQSSGVAGTSVKENDSAPRSEQVSLDISTDVTKAVGVVADAVVGITNIQTSKDFWSQSERTMEAGTGSGVIYKKAGDKAYVVTNHHVVEGAQQLEVTLADGTKEPAKLIGSDVWTDLAVVEISAGKVETIAEFGDSDALKVGEPVIAIGNPLGLSFAGSVTSGVVSGLERTVPVDIDGNGTEDWQSEVLQTDAAINPGNSGGALINVAGQLVGINSMKIAESAVEGIGFAIPINTAIPVIESLEQTGEVKRPQMGITLLDLTAVPQYHQKETLKLPDDVTTGVIIDEVYPNTPAAKAGLERYDVIVEMDGEKINNVLELRKHLYSEKKIGDEMTIVIYRQGERKEITMTLVADKAL
ncbi:S1C family serine protease [Chungangia koreensis]|uniref:S1C family serine protease n=1 Tax=Chungangia koreensis TaxID=752657 RepID=A0ABV8X6Y1_9LACT